MPAGRPRTSTDPHAARKRTQPDVEMSDTAPEIVFPKRDWLPETVKEAEIYAKSPAARVLQPEDYPYVVRLFEYRDRLARAIERVDDPKYDPGKQLQAIRALETMVLTLSNHLGIGPAARARLGVRTNVAPGSKLQSFIASGVPVNGSR